MELPEDQIRNIIDLALTEDRVSEDVTSDTLIPSELQGKASITAKAEGIVAGGEVAMMVFIGVDPSLQVEVLIEDGTEVKPGDMIANVSGTVIMMSTESALSAGSSLQGHQAGDPNGWESVEMIGTPRCCPKSNDLKPPAATGCPL